MKWAVSFPEESILLVRPCLVALCAGNRPAAKLLSVLIYRYSIRQEHKTDAENINEVKGDDSQDTTFRIYRKQSQLVTDLCNEITEKTLHDVAVPVLQLFGYLDIDESPAIHCYDLHIDAVVNALEAYKQGPKQLEKFLLSSLQLEKFLIDIQLEEFPINKKNFQLALEKILIANRNSSNNKRGRKPKPEAPGEPQSEEPQISIEINTKIGNKEESIATSLREDRAPAPIDFSEEKKKRTDPRIPTVSSHSQVDRGNDDFNPDAHEREVIEAFLNADTVKVAAIPKQTPGAGTRTLAADPPVGSQDDSASVQAPIVSPSSDAAQRTVTPQAGVGAASQDGAVQASGKRKGKAVTQANDEPAPQPKSEPREIQRRINEHRGYALEEKTDKIREAVAVKTWCNLHTVEEYERVMLYLTTKDKYWKLEENKYRIGGLTLAKETPKALANGKRGAELDTSSNVPNFDDYVGNGAEERAARRQLFQEMKARGELIS